jgi:hypothetical protein
MKAGACGKGDAPVKLEKPVIGDHKTSRAVHYNARKNGRPERMPFSMNLVLKKPQQEVSYE